MIKIKKYNNLKESNYNLEEKFKDFNNKFFNNEIKLVPLLFTNKKASYAGQTYNDKIIINSYHFDNLNERQKDSVIVHEMVHLWLNQKGIKGSKNIHRGEFLKKAKEIENKSNLSIVGTTLQLTMDDFQSLDEEEIYFYMLGIDNKFNIRNFTKIFIFDEYKNSYVNKIKDKKSYRDKYIFIYRVIINSPILEKKYIEKMINNDNYYFSGKNSDQLARLMKKFPQLIENIDIITL